MSQRIDGRRPDQLRPVSIERGFMKHAEGSALIKMGDTHVICTASVENRVPHFLVGKNTGWITAEYAMLPRSTHTRSERETRGTKGRTQEIQRLIGRALRAVIDLKKLGSRTLWIDCDVLQADGGTRTASISGAYVAVVDAIDKLKNEGRITKNPLGDSVAAVSVGIIGNTPLLDLCYAEDATAEVDMNIVMTGQGNFVEVQGTAEGNPFTFDQMQHLITLAQKGISEITQLQRDVWRNSNQLSVASPQPLFFICVHLRITPMPTLILATRNQGKRREIQNLLDSEIQVISLDAFPNAPKVIEDGETFEANAIKKAREIAKYTGLPTLADDSGLVVDALNGAPGIYSARYAGEDATDKANNAKLIENMRDIPAKQRTAHFCCAMALASPDGRVQTSEAIWKGRILTTPRGANGFGYDPLFYVPTQNATSAELSSDEKNRISHRGQALRAILPLILDLFSASIP